MSTEDQVKKLSESIGPVKIDRKKLAQHLMDSTREFMESTGIRETTILSADELTQAIAVYVGGMVHVMGSSAIKSNPDPDQGVVAVSNLVDMAEREMIMAITAAGIKLAETIAAGLDPKNNT